ncbi:complement resistance protein TraT [bacterium]|nr:complement resistance protein TraT [bacterium]
MAQRLTDGKDLTTLRDMNKELKRLKEVMEFTNKTAKSYKDAMREIKTISADIKNIEEDRAKTQERYQRKSNNLQIEKSIEKLQKSSLGTIQRRLSITSDIEAMNKLITNGTGDQVKDAVKYNKFLGDINGGLSQAEINQRLATEHFGEMQGFAVDLVKQLNKTPGILKGMGREKKFADMIDGVADKLGMINLKETFSLAGVVALATDFVLKAREIRQELGTSAVDSAKLAGNMQIASIQAFLLGGDTQKAQQAVTSLAREFGSLDAVTPRVAKQAASITAQFGIGGENLGKLTKQMSALNGGSLETNLNTLETVGNLARAARVAPADVLNDMAENTETFAKFSMQGGKNLAKAAIEARKLGLNLSAVDKISESILDFETSIEKQMEASVLLGRQLNLDKARQLALEGDLEGVLAEVKNQVGGAEALSRMNVIQRKALADAVGLEVSELSKLAAGQEKVTSLVSDQNMQLLSSFGKFVGIGAVLGAIIGMITMGAATSAMAGGALTGGLIGTAAGATGFLAMKGAQAMMPKAQTGGVVRETGMAVVHKGESIAGTQFGGRESNKLLKQMIEQNATLMNRLTNRVGDLALSS